jgi:hypothetical protein
MATNLGKEFLPNWQYYIGSTETIFATTNFDKLDYPTWLKTKITCGFSHQHQNILTKGGFNFYYYNGYLIMYFMTWKYRYIGKSPEYDEDVFYGSDNINDFFRGL